MARVARGAYAEAFRKVTGRPLIALPQMVARTDSEIFFEALALNETGPAPGRTEAEGQELLARYTAELEAAFDARLDQLQSQ